MAQECDAFLLFHHNHHPQWLSWWEESGEDVSNSRQGTCILAWRRLRLLLLMLLLLLQSSEGGLRAVRKVLGRWGSGYTHRKPPHHSHHACPLLLNRLLHSVSDARSSSGARR